MSDLPVETLEIGHEQAEASIIWLHGLGADGHDFEPIVPELAPAAPYASSFPTRRSNRSPSTTVT